MKKFLVIQLARFGDILQSKRLIQSLLQEGEVSLCVDQSQELVAKLAYPYLEIFPIFGFKSTISDVFHKNAHLFNFLQKQAYHKVYTLNYSGLTIALARLFEKGQVAGYICEEGQEGRSQWVQLAFNYMRNRFEAPLHITDYWAFLADNPLKPSQVNPSALSKLENTMTGKGNFQIALALAGQHPRRSLSVESQALLIKALMQRMDKPKFLLLGTEKEKVLAKNLLSLLPQSFQNSIENRTGNTDLPELFRIIKESDLVLSPDTGTLHCAAFLGTASLSFFCSSAWCFETGAYGEGHICIQTCPSCAPCTEKKPCENLICHEVFSSPALLSRLALNKTNKALENFVILQSDFDDKGIIYKNKEGFLNREKAFLLRNILYEYRYHQIFSEHNPAIGDLTEELFPIHASFFPTKKP